MRNLLQAFIILSFITFGSACAGLSKIATNVPTQTTEGGQGGDNPYDGSGLNDHGDETEGAEETAEGAEDDGEDAMDPSDPTDEASPTDEGDGSTEVAVAETEEGTEDNAPVVMLPAPTSENPTPTNDTECVYTGATDEEEELPIVASEDCVYCLDMETGERVECDPEDWILVASDEELDEEEATALLMPKENKTHTAPTMLARVVNWFLPFSTIAPSHYRTIAPFPIANATDSDTPEPALCSEEGISCCNITPTGSFECFHQRSASNRDDDVHLYFIKKDTDADDDGEVDEDAETIAPGTVETPNADILYMAQAAVHSAQGEDNNVYTLAGKRGVELKGDTRWFVAGSHETMYEKFEASASKITFDKDNKVFGLMGDDITLYSLTDGTLASITGDTYSAIKETASGPMYGLEAESTDNAYIYNAYDNTRIYLGLDPDPSLDNFIQFLFDGDGITHAKTITFDLNTDGYALVLFTDIDGNYHLRMSDNDIAFGGETALTSPDFTSFHFTDLQFYDSSHALLLDTENDKAWIIKADTDTTTVDSILKPGLHIPDPVAMVMDSSKTTAYILSESENRVFVVGFGMAGKPRIKGTFGLASIFKKPIPFQPVTLSLSDDETTLLVGCDGKIKSTLVIDLSTFVEDEAPAAEDPQQPGASITPIKLDNPLDKISQLGN